MTHERARLADFALRRACACTLIIAGTAMLNACERGVHNMYDQAKFKPLTPSTLFRNENSSRPHVAGTVPHSAGARADTSSGRNGTVHPVAWPGAAIGVDEQGHSLARPVSGELPTRRYSNPEPITAALLERGRDQFNVYCAPCHSRVGDGDGMIVRRGFPAPPSYHTPRLRRAPDSHFYQVISDGYGAMYSYASRIAPHDRWAIVAYIRALQLSQHAPLADLTAQDLAQLRATTP